MSARVATTSPNIQLTHYTYYSTGSAHTLPTMQDGVKSQEVVNKQTNIQHMDTQTHTH